MKKILILIVLLFASQAWADEAMLITERQYRPGYNEIGDVVCVLPDGTFTARERSEFKIVKAVPSMATLKATIEPETKEEKGVRYWKDGEIWKELKKDPKYKLRCVDGVFYENYSRYPENLTVTLSK